MYKQHTTQIHKNIKRFVNSLRHMVYSNTYIITMVNKQNDGQNKNDAMINDMAQNAHILFYT